MLSAGAPLRRGDHAAPSTGGKLHGAVSKQTEAASQNVSCRQSGTRPTLWPLYWKSIFARLTALELQTFPYLGLKLNLLENSWTHKLSSVVFSVSISLPPSKKTTKTLLTATSAKVTAPLIIRIVSMPRLNRFSWYNGGRRAGRVQSLITVMMIICLIKWLGGCMTPTLHTQLDILSVREAGRQQTPGGVLGFSTIVSVGVFRFITKKDTVDVDRTRTRQEIQAALSLRASESLQVVKAALYLQH